MRYFMVIEILCLFEIANGWSWYRNGGYERRNYLRSRRGPSWYRTEDIDDRELEPQCDRWRWRMGLKFGFSGKTQNGEVCIKEQALVKVVTWCENADRDTNFLLLQPITIVEQRVSHISTCDIFDVVMHGHYNLNTGNPEKCFVRIMNGILTCVDDDDILPEFKIISLYPKLDNSVGVPYVRYFICSTSMGNLCPGPAKFVTVAEAEEEFDRFGYPTWVN